MNATRAGSIGLLLAMLTLTGCGAFISPQHRIANARREIQAGDWRAAAIELRRVLQSNANNAEAWVLLARLSLDAADSNGAQAALRHALAAGAKSPQVDALRVQTWLATGQPNAVLKAIADHDVSLAEPAQELACARAYLALGQPEHALDTLRPLMAQQPDLTEAGVLTAESLAREGRFDEALQQLDTAMRLDPRSPDPPLLQGRLLAARGQFAAAERALGRALKRMPPAQPLAERVTALAALTDAQLAQGEADAAARSQTLLAGLAPSAPLTQLLHARIELAHGDTQEGTNELERVVARAPRFVQARMLLGASQLTRGNLEQAQEELEQVVQQTPDNIEARELLAAVRLKLGQPGAALQVLTPALGSQAADPQLISLLGSAATGTGDAQVLSRLESANPTHAGPSLELAIGRAALSRGDLQQANAALDRAIATQPANPLVIEDAGLVLLEAHRYGAALDRLARAAELAPDNALYWLNAARAQLALDQPLAARESLEKASSVRPQWLPVVSTLALMDLRAGNGPAALARVEAVLAVRPDDPGALALKGDVESALGDATAASQDYDRAQQQHPSAIVAVKLFRMRLARRAPQPQQPLEQWLARQPNDWVVRSVLGDYDLLMHSLPAAAREFQAVLRQMPDDVVALNNLAWIYGKLDDPRAESLAERAYQLAPGSSSVDDTLGWIRVRKGEVARGLPLLEHAAKLRPADPDVEYHYACALLKDGKRAQAQKILTQLLSSGRKFDSRQEAQRLLAAVKTS